MYLNKKLNKCIWFLALFFCNVYIYAQSASISFYRHSQKPAALLSEIGTFNEKLFSFVINISFLCGLALILFGAMKYFDYRHDSVNNKFSTILMLMFFGLGFVLASLMINLFKF